MPSKIKQDFFPEFHCLKHLDSQKSKRVDVFRTRCYLLENRPKRPFRQFVCRDWRLPDVRDESCRRPALPDSDKPRPNPCRTSVRDAECPRRRLKLRIFGITFGRFSSFATCSSRCAALVSVLYFQQTMCVNIILSSVFAPLSS